MKFTVDTSMKNQGGPKTVSLTAAGKQRVENLEGMGSPQFAVLSSLAESGPATVVEVARDTKMSEHVARAILKRYVAMGLVQINQPNNGSQPVSPPML